MSDIGKRPVFIIRPATLTDAKVLGRFGADLMAMHHDIDPERFIKGTERTPAMYAEYLAAKSNTDGSVVLVADMQGAVAGYVFARIEGPDYMALRGPAGVVHDIYVDAQHRGNGAGRALLEAAVSWLRGHGSPQVLLSAAYRNYAAQRLFEAAGFRFTMAEMTLETSSAGR